MDEEIAGVGAETRYRLQCFRANVVRMGWVNLLDNAVKYTSKVASPHVVVSGRAEAERLVYEIGDNGVGVDSALSSNLFGVFRRLHGAREYPGSGVGLAIV